MAENEGGNALTGALTRKVGPLPLWSWVMLAGAAGLILFRLGIGRNGAAGAGTQGGGFGEGTDFQSTQSHTTTDPETGEQYTTSYSAQGNGFLPGFMTWQAGPMPYQQGDVYVNYPAGNGNDTEPEKPAAPGALKNVNAVTFPGSTNVTFTLGTGETTDVLITAASTDFPQNFTVNETVNTRGMKEGQNTGHMFYIDQVSRGHTFKYTLTPLNNGVAGPSSSITVRNKP